MTLFLVIALIVTAIVYLLRASLYFPKADEILVAFFMQEYFAPFVSKRFNEVEIQRPGGRIETMRDLGGVHMPLNLCVLPYPFFQVIRIPNGSISLRIHCVGVYTLEADDSPSIPIKLTVNINLRLTTYLAEFIEAFGLIGEGEDLSRRVEIRDNLWEEGGNATEHVYQGPYLAVILLGALKDTVMEAVRVVASEYPWRGARHITGNLRDFEKRLKIKLAEPESTFSEARLLECIRKDANGECIEAGDGPACKAIDFNIRDVAPVDIETSAALNLPMQAHLRKQAAVHDAAAQKIIGAGQGDRLQEKASHSNLTPETVVMTETAEKVDNLSIFGTGLMDAFAQVLGRGKNNPPSTPPSSTTP